VPENDDRIRVPDAIWQRLRQHLVDAADKPVIRADLERDFLPAFRLAARAEALRRSRPQREPGRESYWRRLVRLRWKREIDDDGLTLAASAGYEKRELALRLGHNYLNDLAAVPGMPDPMPFVAAVVGTEVFRGQELLEVLRLAERGERLQQELIACVEQAASLRATLDPPRNPAPPAWEVRALAADLVHRELSRVGPKPFWREKAGILWFHGATIDPRRRQDVDTLKADHAKWRRLAAGHR
jgi:hypothetical protein